MGDSGWVHFEIDGETIENEYTESLVDFMYDHLDYGSWAGEFQAQGKAIYSVEDKAFVGTDHYSEDISIGWDVNLELRIPKRIWFDDLRFSIDGYETPEAAHAFFIKNGFMTPEHTEILRKLEEKTNYAIEQAVEEFEKEHEFRSLWDSQAINRSEFKEDGDDLVYIVESFDMSTYDGQDKDIFLSVEDVVEKIKESEED